MAVTAARAPRQTVTAMRALASLDARPLFWALYMARPALLKLFSAMAACRLRLVLVCEEIVCPVSMHVGVGNARAESLTQPAARVHTHLHVRVARGYLQRGHLQVEQAAAEGECLGSLGARRILELLAEAVRVAQGAHAQHGAPGGAQLRGRRRRRRQCAPDGRRRVEC